MALNPIPIRKSGNRDNLLLGGDRELVMLSGLCAFALIITSQEWTAFFVGTFIWFGAIFALRIMAKADPKMRWVYLRHRTYKRFYPPHSTPTVRGGVTDDPAYSQHRRLGVYFSRNSGQASI